VDGRKRHVMAYLADFLFPPDRVRQPVKHLSGGERNRLLLARLFARASNLLVLDEPTNDLDAETLDLLAGALAAYPGTVLVVSHDRDFLDEVATSTLVFDGRGGARESLGGYSAWLIQQGATKSAEPAAPAAAPASAAPAGPSKKDRRELERLEKQIAALEEEQRSLHAEMEEPSFWTGAPERIEAARARLEAVGPELDAAYERWTTLSEGA
jgi:ATP-binding cassette subfamily F protein uup